MVSSCRAGLSEVQLQFNSAQDGLDSIDVPKEVRHGGQPKPALSSHPDLTRWLVWQEID